MFWTPHPWVGQFGVLEKGEPLLFKLKAPLRAIAGGGFFEHYTELPLSVAWDIFGRKTGTASVGALQRAVARFRQSEGGEAQDWAIGCVLLVEPFFWPEDRWIVDPPGWHPNDRGRTYDFRDPEGRRLWEELVLRLQLGGRWGGKTVEESQLSLPGGDADPLVRPHRVGEGTFRAVITDTFNRRCAITGETALQALEAASIRPLDDSPIPYVRNGILLRSDLRKLFTGGHLTVTPAWRARFSEAVRNASGPDGEYTRLHGAALDVPARPDHRPDLDLLRWHQETVFLG